jgi:uncharacterized protein
MSTSDRRRSRGRPLWTWGIVAALLVWLAPASLRAAAQPTTPDKSALPQLTAPVTDLANVIDPASEAELTRIITALQQKTGDVVAVVTVPNIEPWPDMQAYTVDLFENHGRGIGEKGKDNGALVVLSVGDRKVRFEIGYGLEGFLTDGFSGETSREYMIPFFKRGQYGEGLRAGVVRLIGRIAQERGITIADLPTVPPVRPRSARPQRIPVPLIVFGVFLLLQLVFGSRRGRGGPRQWGGGSWSGWSGGVGPFGGGSYGGWGGGSGGGGGGFGGFGGGRSGGGGGGGSW